MGSFAIGSSVSVRAGESLCAVAPPRPAPRSLRARSAIQQAKSKGPLSAFAPSLFGAASLYFFAALYTVAFHFTPPVGGAATARVFPILKFQTGLVSSRKNRNSSAPFAVKFCATLNRKVELTRSRTDCRAVLHGESRLLCQTGLRKSSFKKIHLAQIHLNF